MKTKKTTTISNVQIVGVLLLDSYKACLQCKARVEPMTPPLGKCSSMDCVMIQRYDLCTQNTTAKLQLMYTPVGEQQAKFVQCQIFENSLISF